MPVLKQAPLFLSALNEPQMAHKMTLTNILEMEYLKKDSNRLLLQGSYTYPFRR